MENQSEESLRPILPQEDSFVTYSPLTVLTFLALVIIFSIMISTGIIALIQIWYGLSVQEASEEMIQANSRSLRDYIRSVLAINHLFIFILPPITVAFFIFKDKWKDFLQLNFIPKSIQIQNIIYASFIIVAAFPLAQFTLWLNQQIPLPEWAKTMEESTNDMLKNMLEVESPFELFINLLVIAVIPAIGEELLFRGFIQRCFEKWFKNPHAAVWLAAILFSTFHLQFEGFIPRMLLGALLGYLFYYAGSLWVAIAAHFVYNAIQVIAMYLYTNKLTEVDIEQIDNTPFGLIIISAIFVLTIGYYFIQINVKAEKAEY